jgi:hypothetical protein
MTDFERELRERFHALDLPPAPTTLTRATDIAATHPRLHPRRPLLLLGVAAVVAAGSLALASGSLIDRTAPVDPYRSVLSAGPSFPAEVDGHHVYTVSELISERAAGRVHDGPIALAGYWSYLGLMHSCAAPDAPTGELEIYCHDGEYGITEQNEPAMVLLDPGGRVAVAKGPMLTPWLPNEPWATQLVAVQPVNGQPFPPVPIVVLGHLDDARAADCRPTARQTCLDRFVMDSLIDFRPDAVPTPAPTPTPSPFPFDSPPPAKFDADLCELSGKGATAGFSFVGWIDGADLDLDSQRDLSGETLYVAIAEKPVRIGAFHDSRGNYVLMGRRVCLTHEWDDGAMEFDAVAGSVYKRYEDGSTAPPSR